MQTNRQIRQAKKLASWALLGAVWLGCCGSTLAATVTRGPYLQLGTSSSIVVRWRTDSATDSEVRYGPAPGSLTFSANNSTTTTEHEMKLSGLAPDSQYYYSVGTTATILAGNNADYFFITSPPAGTPAPTRIWVLGDSGTANAEAAAVRDAYFTATGSRHTDIWLMLGDNA
jgi:phosphodiesterase/alkaline phosphatase D-like protein